MKRWMLGMISFIAAPVVLVRAQNAAPAAPIFEPLPYAYDALEPHIDARTMEIHYDRHHRAYFTNFVKAIQGTPWAGLSMEALFARVSELPPAVRDQGGGHFNHALFWSVMSPHGGGAPKGPLAARIAADFGSFDAFRKAFETAALTRFGSGWAWLCVDADGKLFVTSTPNQDNPLMDVAPRRGTPILGLDVWEHAYYLKHQNRRADYIASFWNVVHWREVERRFAAAARGGVSDPRRAAPPAPALTPQR